MCMCSNYCMGQHLKVILTHTTYKYAVKYRGKSFLILHLVCKAIVEIQIRSIA